MLNFGASKPRVKGGARAPRAPPPWIRTCLPLSLKYFSVLLIEMFKHNGYSDQLPIWGCHIIANFAGTPL